MPPSNSPALRIKKFDQLFSGNFNKSELLDNEYQFKDHNLEGYWTKDELAEIISDILKMDRIISTRTITDDLTKMEESYNAPLENKTMAVQVKGKGTSNKKVFFYWDQSRSIYDNNNLEKEDLEKLRGVISILKQFKGFKNFEEVTNLIDKIETKVKKTKAPEIFFDTIDDYTGIQHIDDIARAVKNKTVLQIQYRAYNENESNKRTIHPFQLREYNNRWFVLAYTEEFIDSPIGVYGLDRIIGNPKVTNKKFKKKEAKVAETYFKDIIGVTNFANKEVEEIIFEIKKGRAEYVKTKKWHPSQIVDAENSNSTTFKIYVKQNQELEALILSYGKDIKVRMPKTLAKNIAQKLKEASEQY